MNSRSRAEVARHIEPTLLTESVATRPDLEKLCAQVREHSFFGVCINGSRVELARALLEETDFKVVALVGFPFGTQDSDVKRYETEVAIDHGAHEIEAVINLGFLKDGESRLVLRELRDIVEAADERPVKAVLEVGLLTAEERRLACEVALDSGVRGVCTSGGFFAPATVQEVRELRELAGPKLTVKATGGIKDTLTALALLDAGADRLGTTEGLRILSGVGDHPPIL